MKEITKINKQNDEKNLQNSKRVNIFLTKEQRKKCFELKYKYRISFSTIANIVLDQYSYDPNLRKSILGDPLYSCKNAKTSIGLRQQPYEEMRNARCLNNALIIYIDKLDEKIVNDKQILDKLHNKIITRWQNMIEPWYDYNEFRRKWEYMKHKER